jgi:hypothetical protein
LAVLGAGDEKAVRADFTRALPGYGPTYGDLRFNPCWDSLRDDPRFDKMVVSLAPK